MTYSQTDVYKFFAERVERHGDSHRSLDWSQRGQERRFEVCLDTIELEPGDTVLDLGCGLGHLSDHLPGHVNYIGLDGCEELLEVARLRNNRDFHRADVLKDHLPEADLVVANGLFNLDMQTDGVNYNVWATHKLIERGFAACRKAFVMTMLSDYADQKKPHRYYYSPAAILSVAMQWTNRTQLVHDYMPHDFCLRMYR